MTIPQKLVADRYRLVRTLGSGGMGRVWLARDKVLHRDVAIKEVIPPEGLTPEEGEELGRRTLREARTAARLSHPNVVRIYDVVRTEKQPWIVMEYVASRSLHQVVNDDGPLPPDRVARIGLEVLAALQAAHSAGVLHRDVKPANVLLADDGRVVLGDFGLATFSGGEGSVTRPGLILGSPQYIAPERAKEGVSLPESDLWSLGATLYAAVEGRSPYARTTAIATLTALATEEPDPMVRAGALKPVLSSLLRKDLRHRATAADAERLLFRAAGILDRPSRNRRLPMQRRSRESVRPAVEDPGAMPATAATGAGTSAAGPAAGGPAAGGPVAGGRVAGPVVGFGAAAGSVVPAFLPAAGRPGPGVPEPPRRGAPEPRKPVPDDAVVPESPADESLTEVVTGPPRGPDGRPEPPPAPRVGALPVRRRLVVAAVAIVLLALLGIGYLTRTWMPQADAGARLRAVEAAPAKDPAAASAAASASEARAGSPSQPRLESAPATTAIATQPTASLRPGELALPEGWFWYTDPTGFRVAAPQGWSVSRSGTLVSFRDASGRTLGIDQGKPQPDLIADAMLKEQQHLAAGDLPNYTRIKISPFTFWKACADWEYAYTEPASGTRLHALNREFITSATQAYTIVWTTRDFDWGINRANLDLISASFHPAGTN